MTALGKNEGGHSAKGGVHPRQPWGPALAGQNGDRDLPYPWAKNPHTRVSNTPKPFSWMAHRLWCEKIWADGPRKWRLKEVQIKVSGIHKKWLEAGQSHRIPLLEEGRDKGIVSEIYYMHHLGSGKGYVGVAYHGAHDRMQTHWQGRNRETDPSSTLMQTSLDPFEWVCWPIERFPGPKRGHQLFHRRAAQQEGWWATYLDTWIPKGLNAGSTGGESKRGAQGDWRMHREKAITRSGRKSQARHTRRPGRESSGSATASKTKMQAPGMTWSKCRWTK